VPFDLTDVASAAFIAEQHHGRIEVSGVVGKGTKFEVVLPFSVAR
jgi:signal transduction histidine kinase